MVADVCSGNVGLYAGGHSTLAADGVPGDSDLNGCRFSGRRHPIGCADPDPNAYAYAG
jgi:hypothetical protein